MNARNGKIARLPREIREELNERLERSEPSPQLLEWLNALPEVKAVLRDGFSGAPINRQNFSAWRQGGFQEGLLRRDLCQEARHVPQLAGNQGGEYSPAALADDVATVLAARFAGLLCRWDERVDDKFEAEARVLNGVCHSVVRLQRERHRSNRASFKQTGKTSPQKIANPLETKDIEAQKEPAISPASQTPSR